MSSLPREDLAHFDFTADRSYTLPGRYYYDPDIFEREKHAIFYRSWLYAGHVCLLDAPGKYLVRDIGDQSVIIIRHGDGELRGFHNVCQHRAHRLLEGEGGVRESIVCPYHNWTYELSGALKYARGTERMTHFDAGAVCLRPVKVEVFHGFVFYNLDLEAAPMSTEYAALGDELRTFSPNAPQLKRAYRREYPIKANWKVSVENFDECYHCPIRHKSLMAGGLDVHSYRVQVKGNYHAHYSRDVGDQQAYSYDPQAEGQAEELGAWFLWPTLSFEVYPGGYLNTYYHHPVGPEETVQIFEWYFDTDHLTDEYQAIVDFMSVVRDEDLPIVESVQKGLHSMGYIQGRFVIDPDSNVNEEGVHDFQARVIRALGDKV